MDGQGGERGSAGAETTKLSAAHYAEGMLPPLLHEMDHTTFAAVSPHLPTTRPPITHIKLQEVLRDQPDLFEQQGKTATGKIVWALRQPAAAVAAGVGAGA